MHPKKHIKKGFFAFFNSPPTNLVQNLNNFSGIIFSIASFVLAIYLLGTKQDIRDMDKLLLYTLKQNEKQDSALQELKQISLRNQITNQEIDSLLRITAISTLATDKQSRLIWELDEPNIELAEVTYNFMNDNSLPLDRVDSIRSRTLSFYVTNLGKRPAFELQLKCYALEIISPAWDMELHGRSTAKMFESLDAYHGDSVKYDVKFDDIPKQGTGFIILLDGHFIDNYYKKKVKVFHIYITNDIIKGFQRIESAATRSDMKRILNKVLTLKKSFDKAGF